MGYSPYVHLGYGIVIDEEQRELLFDEKYGEIKKEFAALLHIGQCGDGRAGEFSYVLCLKKTVYSESWGPDKVKPGVVKHMRMDAIQLEALWKSALETTPLVGLDEKPAWIAWAAIW